MGLALSVVVAARAIGGGDEGLDLDLRERISRRAGDRETSQLTIVGKVLDVPLVVILRLKSRQGDCKVPL